METIPDLPSPETIDEPVTPVTEETVKSFGIDDSEREEYLHDLPFGD